MTEAPLYEVFSSIQGEATRVGERHLFVRLAGCDLDCTYCDTPASRKIPPHARIFYPDGEHAEPNPVPRDRLDACVEEMEATAGPHHAIAVTGGEPLLFAEYLRPLFQRWRARGRRVLLETGGHRPHELASVLDDVDIVMADVKLASSAGITTDAATTERFLGLAARRECAVKLVVSRSTTTAEVAGAAAIVARAAPGAPLILQPVSGAAFAPPSGDHVLALQKAAMAVHEDTRVIVQTHRLLHVR